MAPSYRTAMKKAYLAALQNDWNEMIGAYSGENDTYVNASLTVSKDTPFHLAVYSKGGQPLRGLLDIVKTNQMSWNPCTETNAYGNTVLHEAVVAGNMEAVQLLLNFVPPVESNPLEQLQTTNVLGETPLYRAAACGKKEILNYLAAKPGQISEGQLLEKHRRRQDLKPILHAAIQGQHFDTALALLALDDTLPELEDNQGMTGLHLLADMPSAFKSGCAQSTISFKKLFYPCLHAAGGDGDRRRSKIGCPMGERIKKDKHKHEFALELAKELIKKNQRLWWQYIAVDSNEVNIETAGQGGRGAQGGGGEGGGQGGQGAGAQGGREVENSENVQPQIEDNRRRGSPPPNLLFKATSNGKFVLGIELVNVEPITESPPPNPLFIATSNGIVEIVEEILKNFPQSIELVNEMGQNILHVAVMHRQMKIFDLVRKRDILITRLSSRIDNNGYTLLHQVAHMKHYPGGTMPGPALQLQEEIKWFQRVRRVVPPYHELQRDKEHNKTPKELFEEQHKKQLKMAQGWVEKTSQSCSAVAVLVATVVFAAAYTIPGGFDKNGYPIFLHNGFFLAFTVMDVIALASSLTSVVMFLSILTTPFEWKKFGGDIPRKLICGFTLLFFSVMTTMLAFASTLSLVIRLEKGLTPCLLLIAAFLPVSVFAIMQLPFYLAFFSIKKDFCKEVVRSLPWCSFPFRCPSFRQRTTRRQKGF